jgi:hypothetical protein
MDGMETHYTLREYEAKSEVERSDKKKEIKLLVFCGLLAYC